MFLPQVYLRGFFMIDSIGLYIHIPFCKSKCPYCDFFSECKSDIDYERYTCILIDKIKYWGKKNDLPVSSIYFGGGTPSIIGAERLCRILNAVKSSFIITENAEITAEINPDTGKSIDFEVMQKSGFNRISVGIQSAVTKELKALGRIHSAEDAKLTVNRAKKSGINNISLDLMLGIPYQTIDSLKKSIEFCSECGVTHISSYILKIEKDTKFYSLKDKLPLPNDDQQAELYLYAVNLLESLGYKQYEISNFAKDGFESRHNINYWNCGEYIGIGLSAHSFFKGKRFYYSNSITDFENDITVFDCEGGNEEEFIMLSLRLKKGLIFNEYQKRFGKVISEYFLDKVKKYCELGYMEADDKSVHFTSKGFLVSNTILSELI